MKKQTEKYIVCIKREDKSGNTVLKYRRDLRVFVRFLKGREVTKETVSAYKNYLGRNYAVTSANSMIAAVNGFLKHIGREDCLIKQFKVQKKTFCAEKEEITREEYIRLVRTADKLGKKRLSLVIQTICGTGIRVSELEYITVEAVKKGEAAVYCKNKTRTVFLVKELKKKLLCYAKEKNIKSGKIFVTKNGKSISRTNVWREMKSLCREAGVDDGKVFPHNLRHLFARTFYAVEKDISKLADLLGHSSINTTRLYIITTYKEHCRIMEKMRLIT